MHEANAVKYAILPNGKIKIESKKEMKARGMASPNYLDAYAIQRYVQKQLTRFKGYVPRTRKRKNCSWVVA
jgi:two-component sensor histidine kinase